MIQPEDAKTLPLPLVTEKRGRGRPRKANAISNAERQAAFRARHLKDPDCEGDRVNVVVHFSAKLALERLAKCYGVTQKDILERLLIGAEKAQTHQLSAEEFADYHHGKLRLNLDSDTQ
jgi:hypothetical protein